MKISTTLKVTILSLGVALTFSGTAFANDFPMKDIRIIVPFKPGGAVDTTSRIIAEFANKHLEASKVKVENRAGGGGVVGQTYVANAKADGYTILAMTSSVVTNPKLKKVSYTVDDFQPVALYTYDPEVIVVSIDSEINDVNEFITVARDKYLTITDAGNGTSHHLSGLALNENAGLNLKFMHTKGFGSQVQALLGGHAQAALWSYGEAKSHVDAGTVRILAIATPRRISAQPDVPTWIESGLNIEQWATFRGWAVPKGTPKEAVAVLSNLMGKVNKDPEYIKRMQKQGFPISYQNAAGYNAIIQSYDKLTQPLVSKLKN